MAKSIQSPLNISHSRGLHPDFSMPAQVVAGGAREDVQSIAERSFESISA
jgi:hypothetical protein